MTSREGSTPLFFAYRWLLLNRRGHWILPQGPITNLRLIEYLNDHYRYDPQTQGMIVDNGPQRIFVTLEYTPWIYRILPEKAGANPIFITHTRKPVTDLRKGFVDEQGNLLLLTEWGIGLVSDTDLTLLSPWLVEESGSLTLSMPSGIKLPLEEIHSSEVPKRFRYRASVEPLPSSGEHGHKGDRSAP